MARARWVGLGLCVVLALAGGREAGGAKPVGEPQRALVTPADRFFDIKAVKEGVFVAVGYNGRILRTEDGGKRWEEVHSPVKSALTRVVFADDEYGWAVGHQGVILHTRDAGKSWRLQKSGTDLALFAVDFVDRLHGFAGGDRSAFLRTQDGGETWTVKPVPLSLTGIREDMTEAIADTIYYGVDFVDARSGWVVGEYGNIRHTTDGGETWDSQHGSLLTGVIRDAMDLPAFFDVHIGGEKGLAVGGLGKIAVTADGGQTWRFVEKGLEGTAAIYELSPLPSAGGGGALLVGEGALVAWGNDSVWRQATVPDGIYVWLAGAAVSASGKGFAVGSHGILLQTEDFGKTWTVAAWEHGA